MADATPPIPPARCAGCSGVPHWRYRDRVRWHCVACAPCPDADEAVFTWTQEPTANGPAVTERDVSTAARVQAPPALRVDPELIVSALGAVDNSPIPVDNPDASREAWVTAEIGRQMDALPRKPWKHPKPDACVTCGCVVFWRAVGTAPLHCVACAPCPDRLAAYWYLAGVP